MKEGIKMTKEEIKKILAGFTNEEGVTDLDAASEALLQAPSPNDERLTLEKVALMSVEEINANWEEVQKVLKEAAK